MFDKNIRAFEVNVISLLTMVIHLAKKAQIALLITKKMKILTEYLDFSNIFSKKRALVLSEITNINQYTIELQESLQLPYESIYSLEPVGLKTLKTYIETNLTNSFTWPSKLPANTLIFFVK